ncbi:adenosylcobinamide-GDP ribazoletransferase [Schinkia azotoformans]|uniref:adenosylcobinamide-GDP ribazoletransferase n=1 Tax=Schinkia azotoformans TaxID=1454 RepID=UPI002E21F432|nr:adenosylcobinamide-GDP ribazoletransferase [Schinkia azotoformans]MED4352152.1 adenosylcobinamide-GDP ribazoletransferase [Schinkia azotoformans]
MLKPLFSAIAFLSRIPIPNISFTKENWEKSPTYYPIVGAIIGVFLLIVAKGLHFFLPETITAFCIVLFWIFLTGGLHLDGWMDLADGLGSSRTREQMLEIMKDSRVGAMGVIAAILLIGGKMIVTYELIKQGVVIPLLLAPLLGRFIILPAIKYWPYRQNGIADGLGKYISHFTILFHSLWILLLTYYLVDLMGVIVILVSALLNFLFLVNIYKKLKVLTGDCYGAIIEWAEVNFLFLYLLIGRIL